MIIIIIIIIIIIRKASKWLIKQNIPLPPEDQMLYDAQQKIRQLELALKEKEKEIKAIRKKRYEDLEPEVIKDRVTNAKALKRSVDMDVWTTDELAAWFVELKMEEHIPFLFTNRVDGYLFINLSDADWLDMGITNKFQIRKLNLILKAYRIRYEKKKLKLTIDDDDLVSEHAPSELSDILRAEDVSDDDAEEEEEEEEEEDVNWTEEADEIKITEEQRLERALDAKNIFIEKVVDGDNKQYPMIGDVVRVRYVCKLVSSGKVITSTKNGIGKASVEFVLGVDQVIKGFDKAVAKMSVGERSNITITAQYAYGAEGLFPHIPPDAEIVFDLTLLGNNIVDDTYNILTMMIGFRPRPNWLKPLLQEPGLSQKPYQDVNPNGIIIIIITIIINIIIIIIIISCWNCR